MPRSRQHKKHRQQRTKDGFICRLRKIEAPGSAVPSRHTSTERTVCTTEPGTKKGTVASRSFRIDLTDQGLPPSERVQQARAIRRTESLSLLSTLAKGEGEEWIKGQSSNRLRFVSKLSSKFIIDKDYIPTKKEHKACMVLLSDYCMVEPDWMKSIHDED